MKKIIFRLSALLILAAISFGCSGSDESLSFSLKTGKTYTIQISKNIKSFEQVDNTSRNINENIVTGFAFTPTEITAEGDYHIDAKIILIDVNIESNSGNIVYNSAIDKDAPIIARPLANLIDMPFHLTIKKDGTVALVKGMEENIIKAFDGFALNDDEIKEFVLSSIKSQYGNEALLETFDRMFAFYPGKKVLPGEKWNKTVAFTNKEPFIMESSYELIEQNNGVAVISVNSKLRTDKEKASKTPEKYTGQELVGEQKGKLMIDQISGWVSKASFSYKLYDANPKPEPKEGVSRPRLLSSELTVNFDPLNSSAFRDIVWSPNAIVKGDGVGMTVIGMGVVFASLVLLYLVFLNLSNYFESRGKTKQTAPHKPAHTPIAEAKPADLTGEINAAISIALHLYDQEVHDEENTVLTIHRAPGFYSPWSSKIYGLRKNPR